MFKRQITTKIKDIITRYFPEEVRTDVELELIAMHIIQVQIAMYVFLAIHFDDDLLKNIKEGKPLYSLHKEEFEEVYRSVAAEAALENLDTQIISSLTKTRTAQASY